MNQGTEKDHENISRFSGKLTIRTRAWTATELLNLRQIYPTAADAGAWRALIRDERRNR
jgi:hypothetical protein